MGNLDETENRKRWGLDNPITKQNSWEFIQSKGFSDATAVAIWNAANYLLSRGHDFANGYYLVQDINSEISQFSTQEGGLILIQMEVVSQIATDFPIELVSAIQFFRKYHP